MSTNAMGASSFLRPAWSLRDLSVEALRSVLGLAALLLDLGDAVERLVERLVRGAMETWSMVNHALSTHPRPSCRVPFGKGRCAPVPERRMLQGIRLEASLI